MTIPSRSFLGTLLTGVLTTFASGFDTPAHAQSASPCDCPAIFDRLIATLESDYIAYHIEIGPDRRASWVSHVARIRPRAAGATAPECSWVLRDVLSVFKDGHLGIIDLPSPDSTGFATRLAARPQHTRDAASRWSEAVIASELRRQRDRGDAVDPIEGVWAGPSYRIAVRLVPGTRDSAVGVLTAVSHGAWTAGTERAAFRRIGGTWHATVWDELAQPRTSTVVSSRGAMLRMAPLIWQRVDVVEPMSFLDSSDVRQPRIVYPDTLTAVISVVSLDDVYGRALTRLIDAQWDELRVRRRLVIDVRGNEGGNSRMAAPLLPFLWREASAGARTRQPSTAVVLSSPATIAYWQRSGWGPRALVARLRAAPGRVIPFEPEAEAFAIPRPARLARADQQVFVMTDAATVSAAEQLVLWARELGRAEIVGANTGGSIDYQSAWLQRIACGEMGHMLMLPIMARSAELTTGGHNAAGIPPDRVWPTTGDWLRGLAALP